MKKMISVFSMMLFAQISQASFQSTSFQCSGDACAFTVAGLVTSTSLVVAPFLREEILFLQEDAKRYLEGGIPSDSFYEAFKNSEIEKTKIDMTEFAIAVLSVN